MPFTPGRTPNKNRGLSFSINKINENTSIFFFLSGMAFSPMTFTTSPAQSNLCPSGRTPVSTPSRPRSDLGSARKLRLVNEQEELVSILT